MRVNVDIEAGFAERGKAGHGRPGARQDDEIGIAGQRLAGADAIETDRRLGLERVEIVEIGDMRQDGDGDPEARAGLRRTGTVERERILSWQEARFGKVGYEPQDLPAGHRFDSRHAIGEERGVAAELVDDEA